MRAAGSDEEARRERRQLWTLVVLAFVTAGALLALVVGAARRGVLPSRLVAANSDLPPPPATTDLETTALGSEPVWQLACGFVGPAAARCILYLADASGDLVEGSLSFPVPRAWLARFPHATAVDDPQVIRALVRTRYAPAGGPGMDSLAVSVAPSFAARLAAAGVTPQQFLAWLYQNVPVRDRPPWVRGG